MKVAIIGAGAGGAAAVVQLCRAGHDVALWARSVETLASFVAAGGVEYEGVFGAGLARPTLVTTDLREALAGREAILICLPTTSHRRIARRLAEADMKNGMPLLLNPGHTGGALEVSTAFREAGADEPPVAEFSTLTYVARKYSAQRVTVTGVAKSVRVAALPGGAVALAAARALFDCATPVGDVLDSGLSNVNMVLHPPGAVLGAAWIEARGGDFTFYVEGMTSGVARVMRALDDERRTVARAFGHELPNLVGEMKAIGTVEETVENLEDFATAIASGKANRDIKAPDSLKHRYYLEDFGHGLLPFLAFAGIAGVPTPVAAALLRLGATLTGTDFLVNGRTAERMGIAGFDRRQLFAHVRGG